MKYVLQLYFEAFVKGFGFTSAIVVIFGLAKLFGWVQ